MTGRFRFLPTALLAFLLTLGSFALFPVRSAQAAAEWCWDDPIVRIDGRTVTILNGVRGLPDEVRANVSLAEVVITVPAGVRTEEIALTRNYFPERVIWVRVKSDWRPGRPVPVGITTTYVATKELPAQMRVTYPDGAKTVTGTTRAPLTTTIVLDAPDHPEGSGGRGDKGEGGLHRERGGKQGR